MIDPRSMTVTEWCDAASHTLRKYGPIPVLMVPTDWRWWGAQVLQIPEIFKYTAADPRGFSTWQEWVFRFNQVVPY